MAAFSLIALSVGIDLYKVSVNCIKSGFSLSNILNTLNDIHEAVRSEKYLMCIDEIYANQNDSDFHSIGIACMICRRKITSQTMISNGIYDEDHVEGCEEAFEVLSQVS